MTTQIKLNVGDSWINVQDPSSILEDEEEYLNEDVALSGALIVDTISFPAGTRKNYDVTWEWLDKTTYDQIKAFNGKNAYFKHDSGTLNVGGVPGAIFLFKTFKRPFSYGNGYKNIKLQLIAKLPT